MYGHQAFPSSPPSNNLDVQTHLAEELNARLTVGGNSATGQPVSNSVRWFLDFDGASGFYIFIYKYYICILYINIRGLPWWLSGQESACQCRKCGFDPWVRNIPWRRKWQPGNILAWEILWTEEPGGLQFMGLQEPDMMQQLSMHTCTHTHTHTYPLFRSVSNLYIKCCLLSPFVLRYNWHHTLC